MNARIQELAEQSTKKLHGYSYRFGHTTETYFDEEKFAELIVAECAIYIEEDQGSGFELANRLREHFRVGS